MTNIYVGNLPHSSTETELRNLFAAHGAVQNVSIVTDRETARSRGFAFVEMANSDEAQKAMATLNGSELGGRRLNINAIVATLGNRANLVGSSQLNLRRGPRIG